MLMEPKSELQKIPGVDILMKHHEIKSLLAIYPRNLITHIIKTTLETVRNDIHSGQPAADMEVLVKMIEKNTRLLTRKSLRPVINATGVIVHTNLGRAPFGDFLLNEVHDVLRSYNNLEFDLDSGERGSRYVHVTELMKLLTGAEDVLIVNNNAAAVMLTLRTFAKNKEVVVSRGELIEIGGAFRMPEIMAASDCKMVEVGTTNKTKPEDFAKAITKKTKILLKAHRSNYVIKGFTAETSLTDLVELGKKHGITVVYDMGSGLLQKTSIKMLHNEPDVKSTLSTGVDLVTFSGDKLLGGPQAGIIAGKKNLIEKLKNEPMTRALRVGKTVLAMLETVCLMYLNEQNLFHKNPVFIMMNTGTSQLKTKADNLSASLLEKKIPNLVIKSAGQAGGGALPEKMIESYAVQIIIQGKSRAEKNQIAEKIYKKLLLQSLPVLGVLRKGQLIFDVLTIPDKDVESAARIITDVYREVNNE